MAREKWQIGWNLDLDYFCLVEAGWVVAIHMTVVNGWEERLCARAAADGLVASGGLVNAGQIFVPAVWLDLLGGWPLPIDWRAGDRAARRREGRAAGAERRGKLLAAARRGAREALLDSDYDDLLDDGWVLGDPTRIRKCDVDDLLSEGVIVGDEDAWLRALRERAARDRLRLRNSRMRIDRDQRLVVYLGPRDGDRFPSGHAFPGALGRPPSSDEREDALAAIEDELIREWGVDLAAARARARQRALERGTDEPRIVHYFMT